MAEGRLRLGRRRIPVRPGDTVASALWRAGIRTFTRSLKYHRRRGPYCGTGDCPSCLVTVDGVPGVRSCVTPARDGMRVRRERGWPSAERDVLSVLDRLHVLLPVGFYHKTFVRPRWAWGVAERWIRRTVGVGRLPTGGARRVAARSVRCDVLVVGGGEAGRGAAASAAARGGAVVWCDESEVSDPPAGVEVLARHAAIGVYEGPVVALASPDELVEVHAGRIVVATGATESHPVFPGNDLPGVLLGRAAAGLASRGAVAGRAVVAVGHDEALEHLEVLREAGVAIAAVVVPAALADRIPEGLRSFVDAEIVRADGKEGVRFAVIRDRDGVTRGIGCEWFVLSVGLWPRDDLVRMAGPGEPVEAVVCLCEDVSVADLERAWREGYRSSELLKRYTTATMGPCQGAMCGRHLAAFAAARGAAADAAGRTTARPLARPAPLEVLAAPVVEPVAKRTSLHDVHVAAGATIGWSGSWLRPFAYGAFDDGYRAVREAVSAMDVGTLAKFLLTGPDATDLVRAAFPARVDDLATGEARYLLAVDEAGYVFDDGILCSLGDEGWYLTSTSGGADRMEAWLRDRVGRLGLRAHVVDLTADRGAIVLAGPRAREVLSALSTDPLDRDAFPHLGVRELTVADVPCGAIRTGFVGEVSFELHHPRSRGPELWRAIADAGAAHGFHPHGLDVLEVLRLEKGHVYLGQDSLPDDTPAKLGLAWAVAATDAFVGRRAVERLAALPLERKLVGLEFDRGGSELRGVPLRAGGAIVGRVTSAARSPVLRRVIGLGWIRRADEGFPDQLMAGRARATVTSTPFYDPEGERVRG